MKDLRRSFVTITLLIFITGCNQQNNDFFVFADHTNMNNESAQSLIHCLNTEKIEYKLDRDENVLIKKKDSKAAVARCS